MFSQECQNVHSKIYVSEKNLDGLWKDYVFELNTYLTGLLKKLKILTLEELKKFIEADKMKQKISPEIKVKYIDKCRRSIDPDEIAKELDDFESVWKFFRKFIQKWNKEERYSFDPNHKTDRNQGVLYFTICQKSVNNFGNAVKCMKFLFKLLSFYLIFYVTPKIKHSHF